METFSFAQVDLTSIYPSVRGRPKMVRCPAHDDDRPSLAVYPQNTHCFGGGCRFHETVVQHLWRVFDCSSPSVLDGRRIWGWPKLFYYARRLEPAPLPASETPLPLDLDFPLACQEKLMQDPGALAWLQAKYGFTKSTIELAGLGHTGRAFTLPITDLTSHYLTTKFRRDDRLKQDGAKYFSLRGHGQTRLYCPPGIRGQGGLAEVLPSVRLPHRGRYGKKVVVLTEGEFDSLALWQEEIPAVSFTSGAKSILSTERSQVRQFDGCLVWVAFDMDQAGLEAGQEMLSLLDRAGVQAVRVVWDEKLGKDAAALVQRGMTRTDLLNAWSVLR